MPGHKYNRRDEEDREKRASDHVRSPGVSDGKVQSLEKQIESQRRLSALLEPGSVARMKSDAICREMIETLDRLRS